jgi:hypothetical protein
MPTDDIDLYSLMPAIYRERDAALNYSLRGLLSILAVQGQLVDQDIRQLYENLFIETCQEWVIPYIGDLVSNNLIYDPTRITQIDTAKTLFPDLTGKDLLAPVAIRIRADVAKTIFYRRRKGTPAMLEGLARDITGWPAHVVEFFQLLGWEQFLEHQRPQRVWTDLRSIDNMERLYGAFDSATHTVDVRQPSQQDGWHNIRHIGFFLWRLQSFKMENIPARPTGAATLWQCHFSPLGNAAPLFTQLRPEVEGGGLVTEIDVSAPIRRLLFFQDLESYKDRDVPPTRPDHTQLYGSFAENTGTSIFVSVNGTDITPAVDPSAPPPAFVPQVVCTRLDAFPAAQPSGKVVGIDVVNGRLVIGDGFGPVTEVDVSYWTGFSSGLGGGTYDRHKWLENPAAFTPPAKVYVVQQKSPAPGQFVSVDAALTQWQLDNPPNAVISILDNRTYSLPGTITLPSDATLAIEADTGSRPLLQAQTPGGALEIDVSGINPADQERNTSFTLSGVVVEGFVDVIGDLGKLRLFHSTLVPGRQLDEDSKPVSSGPSVIVAATNASGKINEQLSVQAAFSILGQLIVPELCTGIWLLDCIVQSTATGVNWIAVCGPTDPVSGNPTSAAPLHTERSTFLGNVLVQALEASEAIFTAPVIAVRTQDGCVRFSFIAQGSTTPRRYRCQPDLAIANAVAAALQANPSLSLADQQQIATEIAAAVVPSFTTTVYGQPAYAQLLLSCPEEIRTGAEDNSEMGAFCHLKQPQRESNLKVRLQEYLPFGLDPGIIYVT